MRQVCTLFNITRQAVYKHRKQAEVEQMEEHLILQMVHEIRRKMPMVGGRKLYWMLADDMEKIAGSMGRDRFFDFLREHGLLVRRRKRYTVTTNSHHRFRVYTNLIKELTVDAPNRVFVSDITYVRLHEGFCYLALVTDMYSRKIVGFDVSESLSLDGPLRALKMALSGVTDASKLIHHSEPSCCKQTTVRSVWGKAVIPMTMPLLNGSMVFSRQSFSWTGHLPISCWHNEPYGKLLRRITIFVRI